MTLLFAATAYAIDDIAVEEDVAELLPQHVADKAQHEDAATRHWAILPEVGFGPDTGALGGVKFTDRDVFRTGATLDVEATYALKKQQALAVSIEQPNIADERFLAALRLRYRSEPRRYFFGLGNNDQGPDPASTNAFQDASGTLTFGWRPIRRLALAASIGLRDVHTGRGDRLNHCDGMIPCPFTRTAFPDLPGVNGGMVNPLAPRIQA